MNFIGIVKKIVKILPIVIGVWETIQALWQDSENNKSDNNDGAKVIQIEDGKME